MNKISFIIPVKDRDNERIQNCIDSLQSEWTEEVIIIDYGSKEKIKVKGAKIIRYIKNPIWNKSHAINLGIKKAKADYVGTVDCDMILHPNFIEEVIKVLDNKTFIYTLNTRRVNMGGFLESFETLFAKSIFWFEKENRLNLVNNANGGIQIYPKKWMENVRGCDENLIYWGAIDNDTFERATMSGLKMINLNIPILHQEHQNKKELNLPVGERVFASKVRELKIPYLNEKFRKKQIKRNKEYWGEKVPNQELFLKKRPEIINEYQNILKGVSVAFKEGVNNFRINDEDYTVQVVKHEKN